MTLAITRRSLGVTAVVALAIACHPSSADAHLRTGTVAVDYRASLEHPVTAAYRARIFQSDRGLSLMIVPGHAVVLIGYLGEPVFRLGPGGLAVNAASPTAVVAGLLPKARQVSSTAARWLTQPGRRSVTWHDARDQTLPVGVARGPFSVPLLVDGRRSALTGRLVREPAPLLWPWVAALIAGLAAVLALVRLGQGRLRTTGIGLAIAGAGCGTVVAGAFALDTYSSAGTWIEGADEVVFVAVGLGMLLRGPRGWQPAAAGGTGLVAVAMAISKGAVFLHPIVLAALPATLIRLLVLGAITAGIGAAALGAWFYTVGGVPEPVP